jgi:hypothetical protein
MLAEDRARLQKIDELYALRLDQYISLPQVILRWRYFLSFLTKHITACCRRRPVQRQELSTRRLDWTSIS